jgi:predicted Zn-dependent peptidase
LTSIEQVEETRLGNGLTILTDFMPGVRSVTFGFWLRRGARHESPAMNGIFHFIEHAVFKGTRRRSALDIAIESDRLGGHLNAFTTHEMTGFTMMVIDSALAAGFDLVADMLVQPQFAQVELEREQKVIIEEMKMVEDTPDEYLDELFYAAYFPDHPLGRPIEGTASTVSTFDHQTTLDFHRTAYNPRNLVIAAAGNVQHRHLVEMAREAFGGALSEDVDETTAFAATQKPRSAAPIMIERKKGLEQAHLLIAAPWPNAKDNDRYAASALTNVLGGGTSSRLWQSIREDRGLAYSVGADGNAYMDTGVFSIYAGTSPDQLDEVFDLSMRELRRLVNENIPESELQLAKDQTVASILLSLESSAARAGDLARGEIVHGEWHSADETIARIMAVTPADIRRIAETYFKSENLAMAALGDVNGFKVDRDRLAI